MKVNWRWKSRRPTRIWDRLTQNDTSYCGVTQLLLLVMMQLLKQFFYIQQSQTNLCLQIYDPKHRHGHITHVRSGKNMCILMVPCVALKNGSMVHLLVRAPLLCFMYVYEIWYIYLTCQDTQKILLEQFPTPNRRPAILNSSGDFDDFQPSYFF